MTGQSAEVEAFYDSFREQQIKTGVNLRHRTILHFLKQAGLKRNHNVLEIGCGIGTITGLISKYLKKGKITGVDISHQSIAFARSYYLKRNNVRFIAQDITHLDLDQTFDFIVLPDVLEHIPIEYHLQVFQIIHKLVKPTSIVFIHIPAPHYQEYLEKNQPELLQIIDQNLQAGTLIRNAEEAGFVLHKFETYSQTVQQGDYQQMVFKVKQPIASIQYLPYIQIAWKELKSRLLEYIP